MKVEKIQGYKYPNLVAEFLNSGRTIEDVSVLLGYGENELSETQICGMLLGYCRISISEANALADIFNCDLDYLFDSELVVVAGHPLAYWRHLKTGDYIAERRKQDSLKKRITETLESNPEFQEYVVEYLDVLCEDKQLEGGIK